MTDAYAALRHRDFRLYMLSAGLATIGIGAQSTALGWELYARTGLFTTILFQALVEAGPMLLLTLPAGYIADRFDRRIVSAICFAAGSMSSLTLALLSAAGASPSALLAVLAFNACVLTIARPSRGALLALTVPGELLAQAVAWRSSLLQVCSVAGPAIGGLFAWLWLPGAYLFSATTAALCVVSVLPMRTRQEFGEATGSIVASTLEGMRFLFSNKVLLAASSLDLFAVLLGGATYLLPVFVKDILQVDPWALGVLRAAPAVGAACMALTLAHRPPLRRAGRSMLFAVAGFGVATIGFALSRELWLSVFCLFLTGVFDNLSVVVRGTLLNLLTPDHLRGRVTAANWIFIGSSNQIGGMESALVATWLGAVGSVLFGGVGAIFVAAIVWFAAPALRDYGRLDQRP
jgi:MFS family permease